MTESTMQDDATHSEATSPLEGLPVARTPVLAIFGGSFDPIHRGHLALALQVVDSGHADEVLFVPSRRPPHKAQHILADAVHRLEMIRLAIEPYAEFSYSDIEIQRTEGYSFTIDTLSVLRRFFPDHQLKFLMGTDSLQDLHTWHRATELVQHFDFLVYPRPGVPAPSFAELSGRFGSRNARKLGTAVMQDVDTFEVSASEIRQHRQKGRPIDGFCPDPVVQYIYTQGLYEHTV